MHKKWGDNVLKAYPSIQWSLIYWLEAGKL